jgi:hypothetical protein
MPSGNAVKKLESAEVDIIEMLPTPFGELPSENTSGYLGSIRRQGKAAVFFTDSATVPFLVRARIPSPRNTQSELLHPSTNRSRPHPLFLP